MTIAVSEQRMATPDHALATWAEIDHLPRLIVDRHCHIHWSNPAARAALLVSRWLRVDRNQLRCSTESATGALIGFLGRCGVEVSTLHLVTSADERGTLVRGWVLDRDPHPLFGLVFCDEDAVFCRRYADLRPIFGLTAAESRVVEHLLDGNTAEELARSLQISLDTVRSHIRNVYRKLNVSSREGLFRRLQPFIH